MKYLIIIIPLLPWLCLASSALDILKAFNSDKAPIVKKIKEIKKQVVVTDKKDNKNYFIIGHTPEILHSGKLIFTESSFEAVNINLSFLKDSFMFKKSYFKFLENLNRIDGHLNAGFYYHKSVRLYTGLHAKVYFNTEGIGLKFQTQDIEDGFKVNYAVYAFKNYVNVLSKSDFLSLYSGFIQKDFVLKNYSLDDLLANYKKINRNNAFIGLYYNPNVINLNSVGFETNFKYFSLIYYRKI